MTLPVVRAVGAVSAAAAASINPTMPSGVLQNDILLLFVEAVASEGTVTGGTETWVAVADSPQTVGSGTTLARIAVYWARASQDNPTSPTVGAPSNHIQGCIAAISGCITSGDPWDVTSGGTEAGPDTSISITGDTTTVADCLVVLACGTSLPDADTTTEFGAMTNADLANLTEQVDNTTLQGNGGGLFVGTGEKASAGAYTATTFTAVTSAAHAFMSIALKPVVVTNQIEHAVTEQGTRQTVTGVTYTSVAAITSGNFVTDGVYLIRVTASIDNAATTSQVKARLTHGTTEFSGTEYVKNQLTAGSTAPYTYATYVIWTAIAGEGVQFEIASSAAGVVAGADQIVLVAMRLDADLVENTDWFQAADDESDPILVAGTDGASLSFTPPANTDWLVLTSSRMQVADVTLSFGSRIVSTGTFNESVPSDMREGENTAERLITSHCRTFTGLAASTQTFKEQSYNDSADSGTRTNSRIFALNLNKFKNHVSAWTAAAETLGTTDWADPYQVGITLTPDVAGDVWILATAIFDVGAALREVAFRLQIDNADSVGTWVATVLNESSADATDDMPFGTQSVENLTAALHTFDFEGDGSGGAADGQTVKQRALCAFTFELAAAPLALVSAVVSAARVASKYVGPQVLRYLFRMPVLIAPGAAVGQVYTSDLVAGLSFVGASRQLTQRALAGALSFVGSLVRLTAHKFTAVLSLTGALSRLTSRALAGALALTGALTRLTSRALAGALSFSGAVVASHLFIKALTAVLSFSGNMSRRTSKALAGVLSFVGNVARRTSRAQAAALSFVGTLVKQPRKTLAGVLSFVGAFAASRLALKALTATLSFAGTVVKQPRRSLAGALTLSGSLRKLTNRALTSALSFVGTVSKQTRRALGGALSFTGLIAASRLALKAFTAALTFSGTIVKQPGKTLAGTLSLVGALVKHSVFGRALTATLSFVGSVSRRTVRPLAGALLFTGALTKLTRRFFVGVASFVGAVVGVIITVPTVTTLERQLRIAAEARLRLIIAEVRSIVMSEVRTFLIVAQARSFVLASEVRLTRVVL